MPAHSLEEFIYYLSGFSKVRDPFETSIQEFFLDKWGSNAVPGHATNESKSWVFVNEVQASSMSNIEVSGNRCSNAGKEIIVWVVVKTNQVISDNCVGNCNVVNRSVDDKAFEGCIHVGNNIDIELNSFLWSSCGCVGAEEGNCSVQTT